MVSLVAISLVSVWFRFEIFMKMAPLVPSIGSSRHGAAHTPCRRYGAGSVVLCSDRRSDRGTGSVVLCSDRHSDRGTGSDVNSPGTPLMAFIDPLPSYVTVM